MPYAYPLLLALLLLVLRSLVGDRAPWTKEGKNTLLRACVRSKVDLLARGRGDCCVGEEMEDCEELLLLRVLDTAMLREGGGASWTWLLDVDFLKGLLVWFVTCGVAALLWFRGGGTYDFVVGCRLPVNSESKSSLLKSMIDACRGSASDGVVVVVVDRTISSDVLQARPTE